MAKPRQLRGRDCLLAVHCHSRYTFVRFDVPPLLWADLPGLFRIGLTDSLSAAGFDSAQIEAYLQTRGKRSSPAPTGGGRWRFSTRPGRMC